MTGQGKTRRKVAERSGLENKHENVARLKNQNVYRNPETVLWIMQKHDVLPFAAAGNGDKRANGCISMKSWLTADFMRKNRTPGG